MFGGFGRPSQTGTVDSEQNAAILQRRGACATNVTRLAGENVIGKLGV